MMVEKQIRAESPKVSKAGAQTPVDTVANYLRDLAIRGQGCTTNTQTMAMAIGLPLEVAREAKKHLISSKRLVGRYPGTLISIDGMKFGVMPVDDIERCKTILRRFYPLVCDVRTIDRCNAVARGPAEILMVGSTRMGIGKAMELARALGDQHV